MPIPIRWQCCVEGCEETVSDIEVAREHELSHFNPRFKVGSTVGGMTIIDIRVRRTGRVKKACLRYVVNSRPWDNLVIKMEFSERTLINEDVKKKAF